MSSFLASDAAPILLGIAVCAALAALSFRRHFSVGRNYGYRRINWMVVSLAFISLAFMLVVHLVNVLGIETGQR